MKIKLLILSFFFLQINFIESKTVKFEEKPNPETSYAQRKLDEALKLSSKNFPFQKYKIDLKIDSKLFGKESYGLTISKNQITVTGGDKNGLIYGTLGLIEDINNKTLPSKLTNRTEKPQYPMRAIKYDLPWDTYRHSPALDLHIETCKDLKYWEKFLDMMAENRFNALTLWNLHPYTFMIKPKNYPEACPYSEAEMKDWKKLFDGIFKMAEERGIDTYIFPFNIFVSPEFAKAHNVMTDNLEHNHISSELADTSMLVKKYTRECVTQMFQEYPELDGMGITHGEAMGGMTPQEREDWLHQTIVLGMGDVGRKLKLVHRIPLSANKNSGGSTSKEAEEITRKLIEEDAKLDFLEKPIWADLKYNWSHAHSTPKLIKVHGGKLYDTYFNPIPEDYKVTWTARNEDFFCLRWGVPDFVRSHIAENSKAYTGGYFLGSETYIPAKDYFTKQPEGTSWTYAFERQWLFYKTWGRLLYNPKTKDEIFGSEFTRRFGKDGTDLLEAHSLSGRTPLMLASSYDFGWDFTLYSEGFLARNPKTNNVDYISVDRQINQPVLDPSYVSVKDYVEKTIQNQLFTKDKITPPIFADSLKTNCSRALNLVKNIDVSKNQTLKYEVADVKIWSNLGLYYSEKTKGAIALQMFRKKGENKFKQEAVIHLENALSYWNEVIKISSPLYNEMPLVHFSEDKNLSKEQLKAMRFHWKNLQNEVAKDVEIAKNAVKEN
jgi:hypothetical protein